MAEKSYREDIKINKYELAELWEDHSDRFVEWWERYAEAKRLKNIAEAELDLLKKENKEELEFIKADLDTDIRRNRLRYNVPKITDVSVSNCILTQSRFRRAQELARAAEKDARIKLIEAEHRMDVLKGAAEAFDKRTDSLRALTQLMTGGLYSAKLPSGAIKTELEVKKQEERRQELNKRMKERREKNDNIKDE